MIAYRHILAQAAEELYMTLEYRACRKMSMTMGRSVRTFESLTKRRSISFTAIRTKILGVMAKGEYLIEFTWAFRPDIQGQCKAINQADYQLQVPLVRAILFSYSLQHPCFRFSVSLRCSTWGFLDFVQFEQSENDIPGRPQPQYPLTRFEPLVCRHIQISFIHLLSKCESSTPSFRSIAMRRNAPANRRRFSSCVKLPPWSSLLCVNARGELARYANSTQRRKTSWGWMSTMVRKSVWGYGILPINGNFCPSNRSWIQCYTSKSP